MPRMPRPRRRWLRGIVILVALVETAYRDRHPLFALRQLPAGFGILPLRRASRRSPTSTPIAKSPIELVAVERDPQGNIDRYAAALRRHPAQQRRQAHHRLRHLVEPQGGHSRPGKGRRHAVVCLPLRGLRGQRACRLHACLPEPASGAAARLCRAALRRQRLPARFELHLGLGDQPRRPRPDRRRRRQGAGRALSADRRDRRVAADRRDPGDAAGLHPQQSDRPVVLCLHRGLCRAWRARPAFPAGALPDPVLQSHRMRVAGDRRGRQRAPFGRAVFSRCDVRRSLMPASSLRGGGLCVGAGAGRNPGRAIPTHAGPTCPRPLPARAFRTPLGDIAIDPQTQHATLPVQIGRIEGGCLQDGQPDRRASRPTPICRATTAPRSSAARACKVVS